MPNDREKVLSEIKEEEVIELAKNLVRIPSFTTEETPVARYLSDYMKEQGLEVELQEVEEGRLQAIGLLKGTGEGSNLLYDGHLDIDPISLGWKRNPFNPVVENGRLYGGGIYNMKAGVTAMVMAALALKRAGIPLKGNLILGAVVGELQGGLGTVYLLDHLGMRIDMGVVPEPHGTDNLLTTHCGVMEFAIHGFGVSEHISRKEKAIDALGGMIKAIKALNGIQFTYKKREDLPGLPRMNIADVIGGRGRNYELRDACNVCDFCTILIDIRFLPSQTPEEIISDIQRVMETVKEETPDFRYEIEFPAPRKFKTNPIVMPPLEAPTDSYIVRSVFSNHKYVTGRTPNVGSQLPKSYTGNDTGHLWARGIPCLCYGPWGGWFPTPGNVDRYTTVDELMTCTKTLALTALDACTKTREELRQGSLQT